MIINVQAVLGTILLAGMTLALALLTRAFLGLRAKHKSLSSKHESLRKEYFKNLAEFNNSDLIYSTFFKDALKKSNNREELIEYFRSEMELVYKRSTIGKKEDKTELYTEQETLDAQTCGIIRHIIRPWMPEIDALAGQYYDMYATSE